MVAEEIEAVARAAEEFEVGQPLAPWISIVVEESGEGAVVQGSAEVGGACGAAGGGTTATVSTTGSTAGRSTGAGAAT